MIRYTIVILILVCSSIAFAEDTPQQSAEKASTQKMSIERAEKAQNDNIVEQQRGTERGAKENQESGKRKIKENDKDKH